MKSARFHEICQISCMKSAGFHEIRQISWNLADFMKSAEFHAWNLPDFMKFIGFHEIRQISCISQMSQGPMVPIFLYVCSPVWPSASLWCVCHCYLPRGNVFVKSVCLSFSSGFKFWMGWHRIFRFGMSRQYLGQVWVSRSLGQAQGYVQEMLILQSENEFNIDLLA